jgi:hypothetical protein
MKSIHNSALRLGSAAFVLGCLTLSTSLANPAHAQELSTSAEALQRLVSTLADDSMEGRRTGTEGSARAARFIADEFEAYGVTPAYASGYMQAVPMSRVRFANGRERLVIRGSGIPDGAEILGDVNDVNVVAVLPGSHPQRRNEAVILGAHFDHVGIGAPVDGDSIYNGADDDASGTAAVMEVARMLEALGPQERTIIYLLTTGEETGLLGTRYYIDNPVIPMDRTVADLQVEMIGRPDEAVGGFGKAWLTGFERTTLGEGLVEGGIDLVPDPRLDQNFFFRSDNIAFAYLGIPAHTISSFNLHPDYHRPSDEADRLDYEHMAAVTEATARAVIILANGDRAEWNEGGQPEPPGGGD